ncbi:MAG: diacylglycerol/lipid kinase family protein [Actinomycetota bacterium]
MPQQSSQRVSLLGNPAAGCGRGGAALERAEQAILARGVQPEVLRTERSGHAVELARGAAESGVDALFVLGGDGTIRDAVEGLLTTREGTRLPALAILPGGTGNDLVRTLRIPVDLQQALDIALALNGAELGVWDWNGTPFVNVAGVGLDAAVASVVNRKPRRIKGTLGYLLAALATLPRFEPTEISLRLPDREWTGRVWLVAFGNGRCYGGGMQIAPDADPCDGLLDIVVVEAMARWELLSQLPGLFSGKHVRHRRVHVFRAEWVEVNGTAQEVTLDGELVGCVPGVVQRSSRRIRVRVPAPPFGQ